MRTPKKHYSCTSARKLSEIPVHAQRLVAKITRVLWQKAMQIIIARKEMHTIK